MVTLQSQTIDINSILHKLGPWHVPFFSFLFIRGIPIAYHILFLSSFGAPKFQDYWCAKPQSLSHWNDTQWRERAIPLVQSRKGQWIRSKCTMYEVLDSSSEPEFLNRTVPCKAWDFDRSFFTTSLQDQYNLVCERGWYVSMSQSAFLAVIMLGNIIFAKIADTYGRRISLLLSTLTLLVFGTATAVAPNFVIYNILRLIIGLGVGGYQGTVYALVFEAISDKRRGFMIISSVGWLTGSLTLPLAAYYITDWKYLQVVYSLSTILGLIALCFTVESPRWLLASGKIAKTEKTLHRVASKNRVKNVDVAEMFEEHRKMLESRDADETAASNHKPGYIDLVRTPKMRRRTIMIFIMYFANRLLSFHLVFFSARMGGDPFVGFALVNLFSIPSDFIAPIMVKYVGRKIAMCLTFLATTVFILLLIPFTENYLTARIVTTILAKNCISLSGFALAIYSGEAFPTKIRAMGISGGYTASRLGAMLSPFFKELAENTSPVFATLVSASVGILGAVATIFIPETFKLPLPDTVEEVEIQDSRPKKKQNNVNNEVKS